MDDWDLTMEADSKEGGRLQHVIDRVRKDILKEHGVEANLEYEDYLTGLQNLRKVW